MRLVWCISLSMAAGLLLSCDSRSGGAQAPAAAQAPAEAAQGQGPAAQAPARLVYPTDPGVYTKGVAIAANTPYSTGGTISTFSVSPPLPAGLALDPATGTISGTTTVAAATAGYTVTGANGAGSASYTLTLTVNDPPPQQKPEVALPAFVTASVTGLQASIQDMGPGMTYAWTVQGGTLVAGQGTRAITFTAGEPGILTASVVVSNTGGSVSGRADATVVPAPDATLTMPDNVEVLDASKTASVPAQAGMTYTWTLISGTSAGTILSGQGSNRIGFQAGHAPGTFTIQVKVQNQAGNYLVNSGTVTVKTGH